MKHVVIFLLTIYLALFLVLLNRDQKKILNDGKKIVRVFGYSTFTSSYGPGPLLKEKFEKTCDCKVDFIEGSDSGILLQRLKLEGDSLGADVVIGFDQYDLQKALSEQKWKKIDFTNLPLKNDLKEALTNNYFVPYDWGILGFVYRKNGILRLPTQLDDLMNVEFQRKISLQDPRTSSPGMQFLFWVIKSKGEEEGFNFIKKLFGQVHSYAPSWATSYGLFQKNQSQLVFSYITSPLYHQIVEKNNDYDFLRFKEPHPVQYEFLGIPENCRECELGEKFVNLMLSVEGQKLIMEKNFMFPVIEQALKNTEFEKLAEYSNRESFKIPLNSEVDQYIKRWSDLRRRENP